MLTTSMCNASRCVQAFNMDMGQRMAPSTFHVEPDVTRTDLSR
jgi:hypothetical protein